MEGQGIDESEGWDCWNDNSDLTNDDAEQPNLDEDFWGDGWDDSPNDCDFIPARPRILSPLQVPLGEGLQNADGDRPPLGLQEQFAQALASLYNLRWTRPTHMGTRTSGM
eukprot:376789-Heterocapsa_arctica.AAC.1